MSPRGGGRGDHPLGPARPRGSGFLTGKKWELAQASKNEKKYVICNADEGDPGAFMDRSILEGDTYAVLEGMIIAGYAIGADEGVIYCRAEYPLAIERINKAIAVMKAEGILETPTKSGLHVRPAGEEGRRRFRLR